MVNTNRTASLYRELHMRLFHCAVHFGRDAHEEASPCDDVTSVRARVKSTK